MDKKAQHIHNDDQITHIVALVRRLIAHGTPRQYYLFFHKYHEADIADALETMPATEQSQFFMRVKPETVADVLEEMEPEYQRQLIAQFKTELAAQYIEEMNPDDAADLMETLYEEDETRADAIIEALPEDEAEDIKELLSYKEDSAGAIMTSEYIWIPENLSIGQAIEAFRAQKPPDSEVAFYVFIVNEAKKLKGYTSIRNLLVTDPDEQIRSVRHDAIKVYVDTDQEEVARIMQKYDLVVLPVVDHTEELVGIITVDDVVDVVVEEATEDLYKLSGTSDIEESKLLYGKIIYAVRSRLPWLFMTIFGGIVAAFLIKYYADHFPTGLFPLAASLSFVPLLMGLGGNVGNQSATIIVRGCQCPGGDWQSLRFCRCFYSRARLRVVT